MYKWCYHSVSSQSPSWKFYLVTPGDYFSPCYLETYPHQLLVTCYLNLISLLPFSPLFQISSKSTLLPVAESIVHHENFPIVIWSWTFHKICNCYWPVYGLNSQLVQVISFPDNTQTLVLPTPSEPYFLPVGDGTEVVITYYLDNFLQADWGMVFSTTQCKEWLLSSSA